jgi:hypothetical protein
MAETGSNEILGLEAGDRSVMRFHEAVDDQK